jgi:hypothetical protein
MPRKTFTAGEVLAAADVNEYLMDQSVMTFADSTARASAIGTATEGMLTYLEDSDLYQSYDGTGYVTVADGTGWTNFTPTLVSVTIGNGVYDYSRFKVIGKIAYVQFQFTLGSTSAVVGDIQVDVPSSIERTSPQAPGQNIGYFRDLTPNAIHPCVVLGSGSVNARFLLRASNASGTYVSQTNASSTIPFTWATGDQIIFSAIYEVA